VRRIAWMLYLWPGLVQLWRRGSWTGLGVALVAALAVDLALLGTYGWGELFPSAVRSGVWVLVGASWLGLVVMTAGWNTSPLGAIRPPDDTLFVEARDYYLKGNWFEAERRLKTALRHNERDLESRLLLASLLRHSGRPDEARRELDLIERLEGAAQWEAEIASERRLLAAARAAEKTAPAEPSPEAVAA
jgi:tetratricopeptide (TPR) repeat protein